ncbi:hypothetical protein [Archangium lansingense]|uniref:Uncharacterized protein n=1 Tax=Archangium lansingense TaxID=2995310 RepID=A0ABT4AMC8_9BACT|nr:hypothetical protein [Archangium lansinium]MCY1082848.1 hypothetical protein [Archangium lansinium]
MSEQPTEFNVWARPKEGSLARAVQWTREKWKLSLAEAMSRVNDSKKTGWVLLHERCGWLDVPALVKSLPDFVEPGSAAVTEYELGYSPAGCNAYCATHGLHFLRGSRAPDAPCPVCAGWYIDTVQNGMAYRLTRHDGDGGDA